MNSRTEWRFTPYDLEKWNSSSSRVMMVATEPNGGNPNSGYPDMGDWFRTANSANKYHRNKLFHNRCKLMLSGTLGVTDDTVFDHFRFVDLKATEGGASSNEREIRQYLLRNMSDVVRYFVSEAEDAYSSPILPPIPRQSCHPFHGKAATDSSESCHPVVG